MQTVLLYSSGEVQFIIWSGLICKFLKAFNVLLHWIKTITVFSLCRGFMIWCLFGLQIKIQVVRFSPHLHYLDISLSVHSFFPFLDRDLEFEYVLQGVYIWCIPTKYILERSCISLWWFCQTVFWNTRIRTGWRRIKQHYQSWGGNQTNTVQKR